MEFNQRDAWRRAAQAADVGGDCAGDIARRGAGNLLGSAARLRTMEGISIMSTEFDGRLHLIFGRRSIRTYAPGDIGEPDIATLLQAAMAAPSAGAKDPWRFVVVREKEALAAMAAALPYGKMLSSAAIGIVVCGDLDAAHDRQLSYLLQDCAAATENLLLAAHALGLGACWLGVHPRAERVKKLAELFGLPASVIPVACIAIGHPDERKEARTRFNPAYVHRETW